MVPYDSSGLIKTPAFIYGGAIYMFRMINRVFAYPGIYKRHLIFWQSLDQTCSGFWVEKDVYCGVIVDDRWVEIMDYRGVGLIKVYPAKFI